MNGPGRISSTPTPYLIHCPTHGAVFLTEPEYTRQLCKPDNLWQCPECDQPCQWDDDNYEKRTATGDDH